LGVTVLTSGGAVVVVVDEVVVLDVVVVVDGGVDCGIQAVLMATATPSSPTSRRTARKDFM